MDMKTVGIRELKATLSRHLEAVKRGEVIWVTDRGQVVAELRAVGTPAEVPRDTFELRLRERVRDGRVSLGVPNEASLYPRSPLKLPRGTAERFLEELRGDR